MPARCLRHALVIAVACGAGIAAAQPQPQLVAPPAIAWRPPTLVVAGAGQPVRLSALKLEVDIAAGVAMSRVEMTFFNPNNRVLEGKLQFPLGTGQVVSGFALDVDGKLRDAVPVEKARGQQVFEDIARRRVDPGLLQTTVGNNYELRVYPLNPGQTRTVMLTLVEPASNRLQIPLAYAARVDALALSVRSATTSAPTLGGAAMAGLRFERAPGGGFTARLAATGATLPTQPLLVELPASSGIEVATGERAGATYFTAALPVPSRTALRPLPRRVQIVWDTSGSGAARHIDRELALLDAYFNQAREIEVNLTRVADTASPGERYSVHGGDWSALRKALEATVYDGASNLGAVHHDGDAGEALWFSDGLANYGAAWQIGFPVPVFAINSAASSDPAALQALAEKSGGRSIDLGLLSRRAAADALLKRGSEVVRVSALGARELVVEPGSAAGGRALIAGRLDERSAELTVVLRDAAGAQTTRVVRVDAAAQAKTPLAALQWARLTLASLEGEARTNKTRIRELGRRFALATRETSLIVLEQPSDYVHYEIEPPSELRAAVDRLAATAQSQKRQTDVARLDEVARRWEARVAWWNRDFPKQASVLQIGRADSDRAVRAEGGRANAIVGANQRQQRAGAPVADAVVPGRMAEEERPRATSPAPPPAPSPALAAAPLARAKSESSLGSAARRPATLANALQAEATETKKDAGKEAGAERVAIALTPASRGSAALKRLREARPEDRRKIYLDERSGNTNNVGFFLDVADFLLAKGDLESRAFGLTVLSNLAELDLQNRDVLRLLGYRLSQAGEAALAVPIFERVLELAPHEPQSQRDLGLALDLAGQPQAAIDHLYEVVTGRWDARFPDVELIALEEINAIVARPRRGDPGLDIAKIDKRLLKALPLDLRVVLSWDADNTDVDLHVIDPNGEEVFYSHPLSVQGGAITRDATGGYGPEEFALKVAKPGKYRVEANFYGHRQQVLTTSTGLMLWLSSGFASGAQQDQRTTIRVASERGERVVVGEFEVKR